MKGKARLSRAVSVLTLCAMLLMLIAGLLKTVLRPVDAIEYENRPAEKLRALTLPSYLDGSFQDSMEASLADQVPFAVKAKKLYNIFDFAAVRGLVQRLLDKGYRYVGYRNISFYEDALVIRPGSPWMNYERLDAMAKRLNGYAAVPEAEFYYYYVEHDEDIDFETGEKPDYCGFLRSRLQTDDAHFGALRIHSFDGYRELFLKTDHHWNGRGAHHAYLDICAMLGVEPVVSEGECIRECCYLGTRAAGIEGLLPEDFIVQKYCLPEMSVHFGDQLLDGYGRTEAFLAGEELTVSYGGIFGSDFGELVFDTGREGENLLVLGDSYDNALLLPLATCFAKTCSVDLRAYTEDVGGSFDIAEYVRTHDIDKVLVVGALEYFTGRSS